MLALICGWVETFISVLVNILATVYVTGRIISHVLLTIGDAFIEFIKIVASYGMCFYEDVKMFMLDIDYQYGCIIKMLNNGIKNSISDVSNVALSISSSITWFGEQTKMETHKAVTGFHNLFSNSATGARDFIILIGDSVCMMIMLIPNLMILVVCNIFKLTLATCRSVVDLLKFIITATSDSTKAMITFCTTVPLQSIFGLIVIYFMFQYRHYVFKLIRFACRSAARLIRYIILAAFGQFRAVLRVLFAVIRRIQRLVPSIWRLSPIQDDYANPSTSPTKATDTYNLCVICHDKIKSVVLLPCRHLCLCQDCFKQLRRYRRECPMCRNPYEHSIQVYA